MSPRFAAWSLARKNCARLQVRIDCQPPKKSYPLGQPDEVRRSRHFWCRTQPMKARLADRRVHL
jgi:hypothetical protein